MEKIKFKPCPFCGCEQISIRGPHHIPCGYYTVICDQCRAEGPLVDESDLMDGFIEAATDEKIGAALEGLAVERWNGRPDMTNYTQEDMEAFEKGLKLNGGSLYGSSIYED